MNYDLDMPPYIHQIAEWLDDPKKVHPCSFQSAYKGFEIMMALCRSVIEGGKIALPLAGGMDELAALKEKLPNRPVIATTPENAKEYGVTPK